MTTIEQPGRQDEARDSLPRSGSVSSCSDLLSCVVVAFMQNMWVRNPEKVKAMIARHGEDFRRRFIAYSLFRGCLTGRRLKAAFGVLCDDIVWEESTREIGGTANSYFPANLDHMIDVARTYKPRIVVTFGAAAWNAVCDVQEKSSCLDDCQFVRAMHPAARHPDIMGNLNEAADQLRRLVKQLNDKDQATANQR